MQQKIERLNLMVKVVEQAMQENYLHVFYDGALCDGCCIVEDLQAVVEDILLEIKDDKTKV